MVAWGRSRPSPKAIDQRRARIGAYYLRQNHQLIKRHIETISLNPSHTADWQLAVDFELPEDAEANCAGGSGGDEFLFPLVFLKKSDPRLGLTITDEAGEAVPLPTREECDLISGVAAAEAGNRLLADLSPPEAAFPIRELEKILHSIPREEPFAASVVVARLQRNLYPSPLETDDDDTPASDGDGDGETKRLHRIGEIWEENGLMDTLRLLVEHSLVWVPLRGSQGERRAIKIAQHISLQRRAVLRWDFGELDPEADPSCAGRFGPSPDTVLTIGDTRFGKRSPIRFSLPTLGERVGQPLALMPVAYDFPTIYTRRCSSYHFELICPSGLTPRSLKVATGEPSEEGHGNGSVPEAGTGEGERVPEGRTALGSSVANHYLPGSRFAGDIWFRVTVGIGSGAMPILWWLAGAITAIVLWTLAGSDPALEGSGENEIAAGILLVAPALVAALAIGGESPPLTRLVGGARVLLLVTGLSAVIAAAVLIGADPLGLGRQGTWTACAIAATTVTMPLASSWLLSSDNIWRQLKKLDDAESQYKVLHIGTGLALLPLVGLLTLGEAPIPRGAVGVYLLAIVVGMTALANNRAAIEIGSNRGYVGVALLSTAIVCLALACLQLAASVDCDFEPPMLIEAIGIVLLTFSWRAGRVLGWFTKDYGPKPDEVHVSAQVGKELVEKGRVLELYVLLRRRAASEVHDTAGSG